MLIDVRTYKCKPNTLKKHLELYEKFGKKPQVKNLICNLKSLRTLESLKGWQD